MALAEWSTRRIAAIWIGALVLQVVVIAVPTTLAKQSARRGWPRIRQQGLLQAAVWKGQEEADSTSRAEQIATARSEGRFNVSAGGQTTFGVVGMPSGRPDALRTAERRRSLGRVVGIFVAVLFGSIPLTMISLTIAWLVVRRQRDDNGTPLAA